MEALAKVYNVALAAFAENFKILAPLSAASEVAMAALAGPKKEFETLILNGCDKLRLLRILRLPRLQAGKYAGGRMIECDRENASGRKATSATLTQK